MRIPSIVLACLLTFTGCTRAAYAEGGNPYDEQPWLLSQLAYTALHCGLRNKIWFIRVVYHVKSEILKLDHAAVGVSEEWQSERIEQGMRAAQYALETDPKACNTIATPERLQEADRIQADQASVWGPAASAPVVTQSPPHVTTYEDAMRAIDAMGKQDPALPPPPPHVTTYEDALRAIEQMK